MLTRALSVSIAWRAPWRAGALAIGLALAAAAPLAMSRSARPQTIDAVPVTALLGAIGAWTAEAAGLPLPDALPVVVWASRTEMATLHYGKDADAAGGSVRIEALYDGDTRRILLLEDWTGATPEELSVLVHEMVHHLQAAAGTTYACPAEREVLAYDVQERWLQTFGTDLEAAFDITPLTRFVFTRCGI